MKMYKYSTIETMTIPVARTCANCGKSWTANLQVSTQGEYWSPLKNDPNGVQMASKNAQKKLNLNVLVAKGDVSHQVLCPACGHFDAKAMKTHFPKGFARGLLTKYRRTERGYLLITILSGIGSVITLGLAMVSVLAALEQTSKSDNILLLCLVGFLVAGLLTALCVVAFVNQLKKLITAVKSRKKVEKLLSSSSQDELLRLAVKCYQKYNAFVAGNYWTEVLSSEIKS